MIQNKQLHAVNQFLVIVLALLFSNSVWALQPYNMPKGVTGISNSVFNLHMLIFYICCAIGVVVFAVMLYAIIYHRKSKGHKPAQFHESVLLEFLWTVVPFVILIAIAIPSKPT